MTPETPAWANIDPVALAVPFFVIGIACEMIFVRWRGKTDTYEVRDTAASLFMGIGSIIVLGLTAWIAVDATIAVYEARLFDIGWSWWSMVLCFLGSDLIYYWGHRLCHERRIWWAFHVPHHSSQHFNLATTLRQEWTANLALIWITKLPLLFIGFPPAMLALFAGIIGVYQLWIHTEQVGKIGPLEWVLNTASHHRVHHATNPRYLDSNHGGVLIIWDRIFGTFVEECEEEPCVYGIVTNIDTFNPLRIVLHEYVAMARDIWNARSWIEVVGYIFGPPGWSPDGSRLTSRDIKGNWIKNNQMAVPAE